MAYPSTRAAFSALRGVAGRRNLRRADGAVLPLVAVLLVVMMGFAAIAADLMRDFTAINQLRFAAESAALCGLSYATNSDGSYDSSVAQTNISNAIANVAANSWNWAQWGPDRSKTTWSKPVTFASSDVQFINNPNPLDSSDFFVQVRARRDGVNALQQFFLPAAWAGGALTGSGVPAQLKTFNTDSLIEVIGQPASRIGGGPPQGSSIGTRDGDLQGFAALPMAISNAEFAALTQSTSSGTQCVVNIVSSASSGSQSGQVTGCLVNLSATGDSGNYYGSGQGDMAIDQLEQQLGYFGCDSSQLPSAPTVVERGSLLSAFDPADSNFQNRLTEITNVLSQLSANRYYIVPVVANDPTFASTNPVVGFARLYLTAPPTISNFSAGGNLAVLTFTLGESVVVRNASSATGFSSVSTTTGQLMPAPVFPFLPRQYDSTSNGVTPRPLGIVMAPALSPRPIATH